MANFHFFREQPKQGQTVRHKQIDVETDLYIFILSDIILICLVHKSFDGSLQAAQFNLVCNLFSYVAAGDLIGTLLSQKGLFMYPSIYFIILQLYTKLFEDVWGSIGRDFHRYPSRNVWCGIVQLSCFWDRLRQPKQPNSLLLAQKVLKQSHSTMY